jgi:hypothetical protein
MSRRRRERALIRAAAIIGVRTLVTFVFIAAFFSLGIRIYLDQAWTPAESRNGIAELPGPIERLQTSEHIERIEAAVEVYRVRVGEYPETLVDLVDAGLLTQAALSYPSYTAHYFYERAGETYLLHPPRY